MHWRFETTKTKRCVGGKRLAMRWWIAVGLEDRPGPSVDEVAAMEPAADSLPAGLHAAPIAEHQRQDRARPAAAEEAEVAGGLGGHPRDEDGDPSQAEAKGAAAFLPGGPLDPLGLEPLEPAVDGAGAAEEQGLDGVPGVALAQQEEDMGAEAEFGIGVLAIDVEQFVVLLGGQRERLGHDASVVETRDYPLPELYSTLAKMTGKIWRSPHMIDGLLQESSHQGGDPHA